MGVRSTSEDRGHLFGTERGKARSRGLRVVIIVMHVEHDVCRSKRKHDRGLNPLSQ